MAKKKTTPAPEKTEKPRVHKELDGFDIRINSFGEINSTLGIDKLNEFLNRHVDDKKLRKSNDNEDEE